MPYLAGFITPQDYGAAGNGVADDTAAIQAALNAALAGSAVYMPTGTYVTSSPLTIPSYVTLRGAVRQGMYGQNTQASLLKVSSGFSGTAAILIDGTSSAKSGQAIESLSLSGISLVSGSTAGITVLNNAQNVTISDVTVAKFPGAGVAFQFTSGSTFPTGGVLTRVTSWQNTGYGFDLYLTDAQFDRCMAFQNHSHGWRILRGTNNVWSLCRAEHQAGAKGFYLNDTTASGGTVVFDGCTSDQNDLDGFHADSVNVIGPVILSGCCWRRDGNNAGAGDTTSGGVTITSCTTPVILSGTSVAPQEGDSSLGNGPYNALNITSSSYVSVEGASLGCAAGKFVNWDGAGAFTIGKGISLAVNSGGAYPGTITRYRGGRYTIIKPSATSVTSSTTVASDPHLTTTLPPNSQFLFELVLLMDGPTSNAADFKCAFTAPSGATGSYGGAGLGSSAAGTGANLNGAAFSSLTSTDVFGLAGTGTLTMVVLKGNVKTGATAGTFALQWAQNVSNATATNLDANSTMTLEQTG